MAKPEAEKYVMENIVSPGHTVRVDKARFMAMRDAVLAALPDEPPGMTPTELRQAIIPYLSEVHFPGGEKAGWWMKGVQLDLEAKGVIVRGDTKPVRLHKVSAPR